MKRFLQLILAALSLAAGVGLHAQTVLTHTYVTNVTCPGGSHTGAPFVLCIPGSYSLGENLQSSGIDVIDITGNDISLDLNGFGVTQNSASCPSAIRGNTCTGSAGSVFGIKVTGGNDSVRNGSVHNVGGGGISVTGDNVSLRDLQVHDNHGIGVYAAGAALVKGVISNNNLLDGVNVGDGIVDHSSASQNNGYGIAISDLSGEILDSTAAFNTSAGFYLAAGQAIGVLSFENHDGIVANGFSQISNSNFSANTSNGVTFNAAAGGGVVNSVAGNNGVDGFSMITASCYANISTVVNGTAGVVGGAAYASGVCAH